MFSIIFLFNHMDFRFLQENMLKSTYEPKIKAILIFKQPFINNQLNNYEF